MMTVETQACFMPPQLFAGPPPKCKSRNADPLVTSSTSATSKEKAVAKLANDNPVAMQLVKTKMCAFFERGKCASANCRYAHSASEMRSSPNLQKTKLCRAFLNGGCNAGENCGFAHGEADLRVTNGIYKTQICNFYERGYCKKGDRCNHAHGPRDLRPPAKTQQPPTSEQAGQGGDAVRRVGLDRRDLLPFAELTNGAGAPAPLQEPAHATPTHAGLSLFGATATSAAPFNPLQSSSNYGGLSFSGSLQQHAHATPTHAGLSLFGATATSAAPFDPLQSSSNYGGLSFSGSSQQPAQATPTHAGLSLFGATATSAAPFDPLQSSSNYGGLSFSSPQKPVAELASLEFSPMAEAPQTTSMWWQYPMSPATRAFAGSPFDSGASFLPARDPVDMLTDRQLKTPLMERYDPQAGSAAIGTPLKLMEQYDTPMKTYLPDVPMTPQSPSDILDLNQRLASLDSALVGLSADIVTRSATKRTHHI